MAPSTTVLTPATNSLSPQSDPSPKPAPQADAKQSPRKEQAPSKASSQQQQRPQAKKVAMTTAQQLANKKVNRRSSKPIINWLQRKLGNKTSRRPSDCEGTPDERGEQSARGNGHAPSSTVPDGAKAARVTSSPLPQAARAGNSKENTPEVPRRTISLNGDELLDYRSQADEDIDSDGRTTRSSLARSAWSPSSAMEADEDASVRPLPPSAPPSPSPSRSSSSYLSDPRTFRSMAASTKPTTLLSVDLPPAGVAHIAQAAPQTPTSNPTTPRYLAHVRTSSTGTGAGAVLGSGASITFSALPPSPDSSRPSSPRVASGNPGAASGTSVQAPQHTSHHPRNNPRPSSPPLDNASVLTLASSAFGIPGARTVGSIGLGSTAPSAMAADSVSQFGGGEGEADGASQYVGDDDRMSHYPDGERDVDASVRALRPRSSRRGSWGSEASGWSAAVGMAPTSASLARSMWTTNSVKTSGHVSAETGTEGEESALVAQADGAPAASEPAEARPVTPPAAPAPDGLSAATSLGVETTPRKENIVIEQSPASSPAIEQLSNTRDSNATHRDPEGTSTTGYMDHTPATRPKDGDEQSIAGTDVFHSAPTTPMG